MTHIRKGGRARTWFALAVLAGFICVGLAASNALAQAPTGGASTGSAPAGKAPVAQPKGEKVAPSVPLTCTNDYVITSSTGNAIDPGTTDIGNHCDDCNTNIALPFTFYLYGTPFSNVNVGSNGKLEFTSNNEPGGYTNSCLPAATYNNVIFAHWDDLYTADTANGQGIFTSVVGVTPNRILNIEWRAHFCCSSGAPVVNFEARLYEALGGNGGSQFDLVYGAVMNNGVSATIGVQEGTGTHTSQFSCNTASTSTGLLLHFEQNCTGPTFTPTNTPTRTNTPTPTNTPNCTPAGYSFSVSTGATVVPAGNLVAGSQGDDVGVAIPLPFPVPLYGTSVSSVTAGSNGALFFGTPNTTFSITCIPNTLATNVLAPYWTDLFTVAGTSGCASYPGGCGIFTTTEGVTPNRIFNIEWHAAYYQPTTRLLGVDFEVRLFEGSSTIEVVYGQVDINSGANDAQLSVGVQQNNLPGNYTLVGCDTTGGTAPPVSTGQRYTWTYSTGTCPSNTPINTPTITLTPTITNTPTPINTPTSSPTCDPTGAWSFAANYPTIIEAPAVGSDGTFVYAGVGFSGGATNAFNRYDPVGNTWTSLAPVPAALYATRGVYAANVNKFYIFGGYNGSSVVNTTYVYDVAGGTWSTGAPMPSGRYFANEAYYPGNGKIYVIGGFDPTFVEANQTWEYDPVADTWSTTRANIPVAMGGSGTSIEGQNIYLMGSWSGGTGSTNNYQYDIVADAWTLKAAVPTNIYAPGAGVRSGNVYLFGGGNPSLADGGNKQNGQRNPMDSLRGAGAAERVAPKTSFNTTYIYDPVANTWAAGPALNMARSFTSGTAVGTKLVAVGGYNGTADTNTVEVFSATGCFTVTPTPTPFCTPPSFNTTISAGATVIPGTTDIGNHTDDGTTNIVLPFTYNFAGAPYTSANVSSNGNIQFNSANGDYVNICLPASLFVDTIFAHWDDLRTDVTGTVPSGIFTAVQGVTPNQILIIEWRAVYFGTTTSLNFEVLLHEGAAGNFEIIYGVLNGTGTGATVGAQKDTGSVYNQVECNTGGLSTGEMISFVYKTGTCPSPTPTNTLTPTNTPTATNTPICPGSWTAQAAYPSVIMDNAVAAQGGFVYSFGGYNGSAAVANSYKYDPGLNTWSPIANLPGARTAARAVSDGTAIYIYGGWDSAGLEQATLHRYDPGTDTYTALTSATTASSASGLAYLAGKIYKVGGCTSACGMMTGEVYDIGAGTWAAIANYPTLVSWNMMTGITSGPNAGKVLSAGGTDGAVGFTSTYVYDPVANSWSDPAAPDLPDNTRWAAASDFVKTRWVLAGGVINNFATVTNSAVAYNPSTNTWSVMDPMLVGVYRMTGGTIGTAPGSAALYVVGGATGGFAASNNNQRFLDICQPTLTPTPAVTPVLVVHILFQGIPTPNPIKYITDTVTTTLRLVGGGPGIEYGPVGPDGYGFYTIPVGTVPNGTYTIRAKGYKNLSSGGASSCDTVTLTGAPVTQKDLGTLRAGDALTTGPTNFNVVNASDFTTLKNTFGKSFGQPGYDHRADFNQTDNVDATDFSLMKGNFGSAGCPNP